MQRGRCTSYNNHKHRAGRSRACIYNIMYRRTVTYLLAALSLTACTDDEYIGGDTGRDKASIDFSSGVSSFTRSGKTGQDAATALGGKFYVYGMKNESLMGAGVIADSNRVFNNYKVVYTDGSANTTTSNSSGWEYVGQTLSDGEAANMQTNSGTAAQTIRYWDYNAADYTYYAFAVANNDLENGKVKVTKVTNTTGDFYRNGYTMTLTADADPAQIYIASRQRIDVSQNHDHTQVNAYGGKVNFKFCNAMAKVRVGMYEQIPGYSLTIDAFRIEDNATPTFGGMTKAETDRFAANLTANKGGKAGTMTVVYHDERSNSENEPVVVFSAVKDNVLTLGDNLKAGTTLGVDAGTAVYDQAGGAYTAVYPMESNGSNLKLKVDFTLHSSVGETIEVKNATAEVPAAYLKWRPGYAYTYLFKITDQTNATVGSLTGLYPITFDKVNVSDANGESEDISTTGTGRNIVTLGYKPATKTLTVGSDDYDVDDVVYATVVCDDKVADDLQTNAKLYIVTTDDADNYPITEETVANYLIAYDADNTLVDQHVTVYGTTAGYTTQVPKGDGTDAVNMIDAMTWTAIRNVYAVEYTAADNKKVYKIVRVSGFSGLADGTLSLSAHKVTNMGATLTPTLTVDGVTMSNADVTYSLDYAGTYGQAVPATVTVTGNGTADARISVAANTTANTGNGKYTVIATCHRRTFRATFTVSQ